MNCACGCCQGVDLMTPANLYNRPGLDELNYRVGVHSSFFESMQSRLSSLSLEIAAHDGESGTIKISPLLSLRTRELADPSVALLDAWATVADVLTFYQERIANEGYLGTAVHRCSLQELARLVGYRLRPGVAASVFLAFNLETAPDDNVDVEIPPGTQAQSVPDPGQLPQTFETSQKITARIRWNNLQPRLSRPQKISLNASDTLFGGRNLLTVYLQGVSTNLKAGDPLLIALGDSHGLQFLRFIESVSPDSANNRTRVVLQGGLKFEGNTQDDLTRFLTKFQAAFAEGQQESLFTPGGYIASQVVALIQNFTAPAASEAKPPTVSEFLGALEDFRLLAQQRNLTRLGAWITKLISGFIAAEEILNGPSSGTFSVSLSASQKGEVPSGFERLNKIVEALALPASRPPRDAAKLVRSFNKTFVPESDTLPQLLRTLRPEIAGSLYKAWGKQTSIPGPVRIYALRTHAHLFGNNAAPRVAAALRGVVTQWGEWPIFAKEEGTSITAGTLTFGNDLEQPGKLFLDSSYEQIVPDSWIAMTTTESNAPSDHNWFLKYKPGEFYFVKAKSVNASLSRTAYGMSGKTTEIDLAVPENPSVEADWFEAKDAVAKLGSNFWAIRNTVVFAQSEELALAEEPIDEDVHGDTIELAKLYDGMQPGRWIIVSGTRTDTPGIAGVQATELAMLAGVQQSINPGWPNDPVHTTLQLAKPLSYFYDPATLTIYGNVSHATHGETRNEVLGSGDGSKALQAFTLSKPPLTYLSAPTPTGVQSTLEVRVNGILWREVDSLAEMMPDARTYFTKEDHNQNTSTIFGEGHRGSRLPTGNSNVKAVYRSGIGAMGNVVAGKISQLMTRPLGVKDVINPLPASGGADADSPAQARRNIPVAVMSLDRLVSLEDYAFFARAYAGIDKASSARLAFGNELVVHVTIAGVGDIRIDRGSDLFQNLSLAMAQFGDPAEPVQLDIRLAKLLVIAAQVKVLPDYLWENVAPVTKAAMLNTFGFANRELAQDALLSEAYATLQRVEGVQYAKITCFNAVSDTDNLGNSILPTALAEQIKKLTSTGGPAPLLTRVIANPATLGPNGILPAQVAYLNDEIPDCLLLTELTV
ncbi:MAG TPA: putative baseplate assembly protein [Candidatus Acidoferrum sp.]|nr:putative baseplate assembly protein [Candidatus Acidoferrum sp.]